MSIYIYTRILRNDALAETAKRKAGKEQNRRSGKTTKRQNDKTTKWQNRKRERNKISKHHNGKTAKRETAEISYDKYYYHMLCITYYVSYII